MYWLVIDTSQRTLGTALIKVEKSDLEMIVVKVKSHLELDLKEKAKPAPGTRKDHSTTLLSSVDRLLNGHGIKPADLTGAMVCLGPGSFTGTRIGVSTVRAMAQFSNLLAVGFSIFHAMTVYGLEKGLLDPSAESWNLLVHARKNLYYHAKTSMRQNRPVYITEPLLKPLDSENSVALYAGSAPVGDQRFKPEKEYTIKNTPFKGLVEALLKSFDSTCKCDEQNYQDTRQDFQGRNILDWERNLIPMYLQKPLAKIKDKRIIKKINNDFKI